jgi:hypothetical protein
VRTREFAVRGVVIAGEFIMCTRQAMVLEWRPGILAAARSPHRTKTGDVGDGASDREDDAEAFLIPSPHWWFG